MVVFGVSLLQAVPNLSSVCVLMIFPLFLSHCFTSLPSIFPPDYMLQLLVIPADQGRVIYLYTAHVLNQGDVRMQRERIERGEEEDGGVLSLQFLYIWWGRRQMKEMRRTDNLAAVKRDFTLN